MCDEFTRESIGGELGRSITADDVIRVLDRAYHERGAPRFMRCDKGPEFVAAAIVDWCRFMGTGAAFIDPGSPWQNPWVESFNSRVRDELFAREISPASARRSSSTTTGGTSTITTGRTARSATNLPRSSPRPLPNQELS